MANVGSGAWLACAALAHGVIALIYTNRQIQRSPEVTTEQTGR